MIGKLLDILEADDRAGIGFDAGKTRGCLMDIHQADRLERRPGPAGLKGSCAHVIGARHHRRGKQERVFHGNAADIRFQQLPEIFLSGDHIILDPAEFVHQGMDRHLMRFHAGIFTHGVAGHARQRGRNSRCRHAFIIKPDSPQQFCRVHGRTGSGAGRIFAQHAFNHFAAVYLSVDSHTSFSIFL